MTVLGVVTDDERDRKCEIFWTGTKYREILRTAYTFLYKRKVFSHAKFGSLVESTCRNQLLGPQYIVKAHTLTRFARDQSSQDSTPLKSALECTGLALSLLDLIKREFSEDEELMSARQVSDFISLCAKLEAEAIGELDPSGDRHVTNLENIKFSTVANFLGFNLDTQENVQKLFFNEGDADYCRFLTYRYTDQPGKILKSLTVINRPNSDLPIVTYRNYYQNQKGGGVRQSIGILLLTKDYVYMLGKNDGGRAMKVICFERPHMPQDLYTGLILTQGENNKAVCSRVLMKRTDEIKDHGDTKTGIFTFKQLSRELDLDDANRLRNTVRSKITKQLFYNSNSIGQAELVGLVGGLFMQSGHSLTLGKAETTFNPLDESNIPYNSALELSDI